MPLVLTVLVVCVVGYVLWRALGDRGRAPQPEAQRVRPLPLELASPQPSAGFQRAEPGFFDHVKHALDANCRKLVDASQLLASPMAIVTHRGELWVSYRYATFDRPGAKGFSRVRLNDGRVQHFFHDAKSSRDALCLVSDGTTLWVSTDKGFLTKVADDETWNEFPADGEPWATWRFSAACCFANRTVFVAPQGALEVHRDGVFIPYFFTPLGAAPTTVAALDGSKLIVLTDEEAALPTLLDLSTSSVSAVRLRLPSYPQAVQRLATGEFVVGASGALGFLNPSFDGPAGSPELMTKYEYGKALSGGGGYWLITGIAVLDVGRVTLVFFTSVQGAWALLMPSTASRYGQVEFSKRLFCFPSLHKQDEVHLDTRRGESCYAAVRIDHHLIFASKDIYSMDVSPLGALIESHTDWME